MDATIPEDSAGRLPREEGALRPLDEGLAKVRQILEKTLGPERAGELIPSEKAVEGITQENFQWANRHADGPVVDRYTAVFDGIKTDFTTAKANGETVTQEFDGDQSQPELMLGQWRELIRKDGRALEAIEYSAAPVASPVTTTTTASITPSPQCL